MSHTLATPKRSLLERMARAKDARSLGLLFDSSPGIYGPIGSWSKGLCLWFSVRGNAMPARAPLLGFGEGELILKSGQRFDSWNAMPMQAPDGSSFVCIFLSAVPVRERELRFSTRMFGDTPLEFIFHNPTYHTNPPAREAMPLPQTVDNGPISLTLRTLKLERVRNDGPAKWLPKLTWSLTHDGRNADAWFQKYVYFYDESGSVSGETGLFSDVVWRVHVTLLPTNDFPHDETKVQWLGTIDPEHAATLQPGMYKLFEASKDRYDRVGVLGPGQFVISADGIESSLPPTSKTLTLGQLPENKQLWNLPEPVAFIRLRGVLGGEQALVVRDLDGNPVELKRCEGGHGFFYYFPSTPVRIGVARRQVNSFDFYVKTPEIPGLEQGQLEAAR
jgi:hypothetical protein